MGWRVWKHNEFFTLTLYQGGKGTSEIPRKDFPSSLPKVASTTLAWAVGEG